MTYLETKLVKIVKSFPVWGILVTNEMHKIWFYSKHPLINCVKMHQQDVSYFFFLIKCFFRIKMYCLLEKKNQSGSNWNSTYHSSLMQELSYQQKKNNIYLGNSSWWKCSPVLSFFLLSSVIFTDILPNKGKKHISLTRHIKSSSLLCMCEYQVNDGRQACIGFPMFSFWPLFGGWKSHWHKKKQGLVTTSKWNRTVLQCAHDCDLKETGMILTFDYFLSMFYEMLFDGEFGVGLRFGFALVKAHFCG